MERNSFIFYKSFYEAIKELDKETQTEIYNAILSYQFENIEVELSGVAKAIFTLIKPQLDANNAKFENGCKGAEYGKMGGRPKKEKPQKNPKETPKKPQNNPEKTPNVNENVNDNVNDNVNVNVKGECEGGKQTSITDTLSEAEASSSDDMSSLKSQKSKKKNDTAKASKHKYGEYKNVLLKDEELQALQEDFANWEELIKYLDEYIEMKGYKAKSHYLCIRKWVVKAVKEEQLKNLQTSEDSWAEFLKGE